MPTLKLDSLRETVAKALDFFSNNRPARIDMDSFEFPLVIGSGNGFNTARILFADKAAIFANESNLKQLIRGEVPLILEKKMINEVVVISASGEKDSIWEIKLAKKYGLKTILLTCSPFSSAAQLADQVFSFRKLPEPYTYNVSTYLGMLLGASGENPDEIIGFLKDIASALPGNFRDYRAYSFILPDEYAAVGPMVDVKKSELFGPKLSLRAFSYGEARHAKFVIRDPKELVISFGQNEYFGSPMSRWEIKLPASAKNGTIMAAVYYLIGFIQEAKPPYYKRSIAAYCTDYGYRAYDQKKPFEIIVPGN